MEDDLNALLEEALRAYSNREPRPGLEERVLYRVRAAGKAPRLSRWAFAMAALAGLTVAAGMFLARRASAPRPPAMAHAVVPAPAPAITPVLPERPRRIVRHRHAKYPKQPQFPAPEPLSAEERALLALVRRAPDEARQVLAEARPREPEPLRIDKIEIPPLRSDGLN